MQNCVLQPVAKSVVARRNWQFGLLMVVVAGQVLGCSTRSVEDEFKFLGLADNEASNEGPSGSIDGVVHHFDTISIVREAPNSALEAALKADRVIAQENHNGFVYWAVEECRDIPFEGATAWVIVVDRFKSRRPER